jgi:glycerol-3-phosphate dehydrogenase (NAD(P)+)
MATVTIIGAGMMGTAMCWPLSDRGHSVRLVGTPLDEEIIRAVRQDGVHPRLRRTVPAGVEAYGVNGLSQAVEGADLIISGVSSFGVDWFAQAAGPLLRPEVPVLSVTKGMQDLPDGSLQILPDVLDGQLPPEKRGKIALNAIGGPCIAHELAARRQTAVVFAGRDPALLARLRQMLATSYYHVWTSTDIAGVETCAALKNAYAMGVSIAVGMMEAAGPDGLALMYNPQAALFGQSCYEMRKLLRLTGGGEASDTWLPGPGDLYVTVFGGRTLHLGKLLGQGVPFAEAQRMLSGVTLESVAIITRVARALRTLSARGMADLRDFPLMLHMDAIINQGEKVAIPWDRFFYQPEA